jgi:hypothetical protein
MKSKLALLILGSLLVTACSTTQPPVDPYRDPTIIGAVSGAVDGAAQPVADVQNAATTGRRIGTAVGVFAAIFGGGKCENIEDSIDRFLTVRAAGEVIGAAVGVAQVARKMNATDPAVSGPPLSNPIVEGWNRGLALDVQMAELQKIDGIEVTRPAVDQLDIRFAYSENAPLHAIACAIGNGVGRSIVVEAPADLAFEVRERLIEQGLPSSLIESHRNQDLSGIVIHVFLVKEILGTSAEVTTPADPALRATVSRGKTDGVARGFSALT